MEKKIPLRRCVVTQEQLPKASLLRIVRTPEALVIIDVTSKANGRGAYIKKDINVALKAKKSKVLDKHLEVKISDEFYDSLIEFIKNEQ